MGQPLGRSAAKLRAARTYATSFAAAFGTPEITPERIVKAIAQFERTLISANSPYDRYLRGEYQFTTEELRGYALFFGGDSPTPAGSKSNAPHIRSLGCANCHGGPRTLTETYHNNGLDTAPADSGREAVTKMPYDRGRFRVVTLRNIALTAPYMHDGRFQTLEEVVDHYSDHVEASPTLSPTLRDTAGRPIELHLTTEEKKALIAFLDTLTDSTFITDPRFSDPKQP